MPDYKAIYNHHADQYDRLVSREDYEGNLPHAINEIKPLAGIEVIELGAGTGRVTRLLSPQVKSIRAFDRAQAMLDIAAQSGLENCQFQVADHRSIPAENTSADLVISGWSVCHLATENENWQAALQTALAEMKRVLRPGGTIILIETLGTGYETPTPPPNLIPYFDFLAAQGFQTTWIRTDLKFHSVEEAAELTTFFWGASLVDRLINVDSAILPECTGLWWVMI